MTTTIRRLETTDEYAAAEELQQIAWGSGPIEAVPSHLMVTMQHESGLVLGAFTPEQRLVGFVLAFLGRDAEGLKHCSHMAATHPASRGQDIAYRLKLAQRAEVLKDGLTRATWTHEPLLYPNATLNIAKLGAICRTYRRNIYGLMRDSLNTDLPTDRFYVRWEVDTPRVAACAAGARVAAPVADHLLTQVVTQEGVPILAGVHALPPGDAPVAVQIPKDFLAVKRAVPAAALAWRMTTRSLFESAFAAGYTVVNFTADGPDLGRYTLTKL
jgi:predicted GNAT superfamily acetyltransferase